MGWVFALLQADSNAAAEDSSHCVSYTLVDWFNCEWRVRERFVKMLRTFTDEEYADMVYVYGYCNGNANAAVDEYRRSYPLCRTPNRDDFTNVLCALRECGTLPSVHVSSERRSIHTVEEQEEIVSMVQRSPTTRPIGPDGLFVSQRTGSHSAGIHVPFTNYFVCRWFCVVHDPKPPLHSHN